MRSLDLQIFAWGYHDEGTAHHCRSLQLPEERSPGLFRKAAGSLRQGYQFDGLDGTQDGGSTGAVVLAESHLAIHTWPERDGATLDVYVCNFTSDNTAKAESVYKTLIAAFEPGDVMVERMQRGRDLPLKTRRAA